MKLELKKITINQTAKTFALVTALVNGIFSIIGLVTLALGMDLTIAFNFIISIAVTDIVGKSILLIVTPVFSFIFAYIATAVLCVIYNLSAKYTGGISVKVESSEGKV